MYLAVSMLCVCLLGDPLPVGRISNPSGATRTDWKSVLHEGKHEVRTRFVQVAPGKRTQTTFQRSPGQDRAAVLIHGLSLSRDDQTVASAGLQIWQLPGSPIIQALRSKADVYAFAYGQNVSVDRIAELPALKEGVARLRKLGYREIVLLGHSAGGLVARQFVEDNPDAGVTRVVQVCTPNGGSPLALLPVSAPSQRAFLDSITERGRQRALERRDGKTLPRGIQFVCVVGNGIGSGDIAVSCRCQWPEDLQKQGIPVVHLETLHFLVMGDRDCAATLADAVCRERPRWNDAEVQRARKLLGR
jgi:pimeloyl-ACP methyl ester carboxylesterase